MGYPEKRGDYYRGRYKIGPGRYGTVTDDQGRTIRFERKRDAKQAADAAEVAVRASTHIDRSAIPTLGDFVQAWWDEQELAESTMQNYASHIQGHILPHFGETLLSEITPEAVSAWAREQRALLYAPSSVQTYRSLLHLILEDARKRHPGALPANPAEQHRNRGRRAGRGRSRGPEKTVTDPLGALLVAERAALMTGRDDEFVQVVTETYTGMRTGEVTGLDRRYVRQASIRVEQQLYELDSGVLVQGPPKDDSYRDIDLPPWLRSLLSEQAARTQAPPCACHQMRTVFRSASLTPGLEVTRADIAAAAGVGPATVSRARFRPDLVAPATRERVLVAMDELGVIDAPAGEQLVPHWSRDDYRRTVSTPAASGWYPDSGPRNRARPVCVVAGEQWPGTVVRGRHSATQATACWAPIAAGLTPHGLRHTHSSWLEDIGTPKVLIDERMGHLDSSVSARYKHVLPPMRARMLAGLTELWESSLTARADLDPRSPVPVLDRLLQGSSRRLLSPNSPRLVIAQAVERMRTVPDLHVSKWSA